MARELTSKQQLLACDADSYLKVFKDKSFLKQKNKNLRANKVYDEHEAVYKCPHCGNGIKEYKLN